MLFDRALLAAARPGVWGQVAAPPERQKSTVSPASPTAHVAPPASRGSTSSHVSSAVAHERVREGARAAGAPGIEKCVGNAAVPSDQRSRQRTPAGCRIDCVRGASRGPKQERDAVEVALLRGREELAVYGGWKRHWRGRNHTRRSGSRALPQSSRHLSPQLQKLRAPPTSLSRCHVLALTGWPSAHGRDLASTRSVDDRKSDVTDLSDPHC